MILILSCQSSQTGNNQARIEKTAEIEHISDYIGEIRTSEITYDCQAQIQELFAPFLPFSYTADYHIIAYFDGHEEYESIEAFIFNGNSGTDSSDRRIRAILTRHDNSQVDFVNFPLQDPGSREVHSTDIHFRTVQEGIGSSLELTDHENHSWKVIYVSDYPLSSEWGGLTDVGGHSPDGGLPLFYRDASGIASGKSYILFDNAKYTIPVNAEASAPPFFIGHSAYVSSGYSSGIYRTGEAQWPRAGFRADSEADEISLSRNRFSWNLELEKHENHKEIRSIVSRSPDYSPERWSKLIFNPPLPDILSMPVGTTADIRFQIDFDREPEQVYGDIRVVKHSESTAEIHFLPQYPGWAKENRGMFYTIRWDDETVYSSAVMAREE